MADAAFARARAWQPRRAARGRYVIVAQERFHLATGVLDDRGDQIAAHRALKPPAHVDDGLAVPSSTRLRSALSRGRRSRRRASDRQCEPSVEAARSRSSAMARPG
jgi:hypothetical protein